MAHSMYLGDGVSVELRPGQVVLTTSDGVATTNTIYLDAEVLMALRAWLRHHVDHQRGDVDETE